MKYEKIINHNQGVSGYSIRHSLTNLSVVGLLAFSYNAMAEKPKNFASHQIFDLQNTCIVQFDDSVNKFDVSGKVRGLMVSANAKAKHIYQHSIKGFAVNLSCDTAKTAFANNSDIVSFEDDKAVIAFPRGGKPNKGNEEPAVRAIQFTPWGVDKVGTQDGSGKTAWVIDTGIDLDHPDLNVDTDKAFSAFNKGRDSGFDDRHGHGTHVAGTIAAKDDGFDVIGVAAGATVVPIKVLDSRGSGSTSGVIAGVDHVAGLAKVGDCANMSLGGSSYGALDTAVNAAAELGIIFIVAAGNEGADADNYSPARASAAITISAIDSDNNLTNFSNWGTAIDYAAPGYDIESLQAGGGVSSPWAGTSMAAPHACGVALINGSVTTNGEPIKDPYNRDPILETIISL